MTISRIKEGQRGIGTMLRLVRNPAVAQIARHAGLDFVMLDLEHGAYAFETLADFCAVARGAGLDVLARVPELARGYVSRALDCGVRGVMAPMVETAAQARALAAWSKYPPLGRRGFGSAGGHTDYAEVKDAAAFFRAANAEILAIAQVESGAGADNADMIAAVPGLDVLLIGPNDLAASIGRPGELACAEVESAIEKIAAAARAHGKALGMHAGPELLARWAPAGLRIFICSMDGNILLSGFGDIRERVARITVGAHAPGKTR